MTVEIEFWDDELSRQTGSWNPEVGTYTERFVASKTGAAGGSLKTEELSNVIADSKEILGRCCNPDQLGDSNAILVVGYVQSGKTLSFTTVAALARDNGFGAVIVLAGSTNNLKKQSEDRLVDDLGLLDVRHAWIQETNPTEDQSADLKQVLSEWRRRRDGTAKKEKPALLITVLKHYGRIAHAAKALASVKELLDDVPVLVIDDESDQASPNTKARSNLVKGTSDKSQTYDAILELRNSLPHHTYLQYTATPQANLLLAITDTLNPTYAKVIDPGPAYVGGIDFFQKNSRDIVVELDSADICDPKNLPEEAPESLQEAFRLFVLGAAASDASLSEANRSMLVQVSQSTGPHSVYADWLNGLKETWLEILEDNDGESSAVLIDEFRESYKSLSKTVPDLEDFDILLEWLPETLSSVRIATVNSQVPKDVNWRQSQYWVLVGGMKLDRGYTVEGLTVTYMPRVLSDNADVLQQRARFFGYKRHYLGFCRVFIPKQTIRAFTDYVADEEFLRSSLVEHSGQPLSAWRRDFLMAPNLRQLTRPNVVGRKMKRLSVNEGWVSAKRMDLSSEGVRQNLGLFRQLIDYATETHGMSLLTDVADVVDRRKVTAPTTVAMGVSSEDIRDFLLNLKLEGISDRTMVTALVQALAADEIGGYGVDVVVLNGMGTDRQKGRNLASLQSNIFVGRNPKEARRKEDLLYSGDREMRVGVRPTLQLRSLLLGVGRPAEWTEAQPFPWFSFHLPKGMDNDLVIEEFDV